jgi:hypothetical protein
MKQDQISLLLAPSVELVAALMLSLSTPAIAAEGVKINDLVVAAPMPDAQRTTRGDHEGGPRIL